MSFFLDYIAGKLANNPPGTYFDLARFKLFEEIDQLFSNDSFLYSGESYRRGRRQYLMHNPVKDLYEYQIEKALEEIETFKVDEGLVAWQFYNMGYVVKTPSATIGFDVVRGLRSYHWVWDVPDWIVPRVADSLDALFVTHYHRDHCDQEIIERMLAAGKPVFVPEGCRVRTRYRDRLTRARHHASFDIPAMHVTSYRGRHIYRESPFDLPLTAYEVITAEGKKIFFTGDLDYTSGETYPFKEDIDLLMLHCGGISPLYDDQNPNDLGDDDDAFFIGLQKFKTKYVIAGHLAELGHPLGGGRERYMTAFDIFFQLVERRSTLFLVMFWGEHYHFPV